MGDTYSAATPRGRVNQLQRDYAEGRISFNQMRTGVRDEGYRVTGSAKDIRERYGRRRGRRQ